MDSRVPGRVTVLIADDDPEDRMMTQEAFGLTGPGTDVRFVEDGAELMDYLRQRGRYADPEASPRPGLVVVDLNMPRKNGWEAVREIRADDRLRDLPVVVLTTSRAEEDVCQGRELKVDSYLVKPVTVEAMLALVKSLTREWLGRDEDTREN